MSDLVGRTVLVTGSTHGIGRAVALELAHAGARVAVHGRSALRAEEIASELASQGKLAGRFLADLSSPVEVAELLTTLKRDLPEIDTLVAVAGADVLTGPAASWSFERKLDELWRVDVLSTML